MRKLLFIFHRLCIQWVSDYDTLVYPVTWITKPLLFLPPSPPHLLCRRVFFPWSNFPIAWCERNKLRTKVKMRNGAGSNFRTNRKAWRKRLTGSTGREKEKLFSDLFSYLEDGLLSACSKRLSGATSNFGSVTASRFPISTFEISTGLNVFRSRRSKK